MVEFYGCYPPSAKKNKSFIILTLESIAGYGKASERIVKEFVKVF